MTSRRLDSNTSRRMEFLLPRSVGPATCNSRWKKEGGSEFMAFPSSHSIYRPKDNNGSENNNDKKSFVAVVQSVVIQMLILFIPDSVS